MNEKDEGVSEEFKKMVEELIKKLEPKDKENNALYQKIKEICEQDEKDND